MRLPTFPCELVVRSGARVVDLRSPAEFARDHLPGAVNVPLFDDQERAIVGTLYKQESPDAAYQAGLAMVEQGMGTLLAGVLGRPVADDEWRARFRQLAEGLRSEMGTPRVALQPQDDLGALGPDPLIVHCWRGGMRSRSVALLLREMGAERVGLLDGGYKAYRRWVLDRLEALAPQDLPLITLRGRTGVGKTELLERCEAAHPHSTLDLERLAGHRSSVLGAVGREPVSQPRFESRLLQRLDALRAAGTGPWLVEGESRKVGDVVVPEAVFAALERAPQIRLHASLEARLALLGRDYLGLTAEQAATDAPVALGSEPAVAARLREVAEAVDGLRKPLGGEAVDQLQTWLHAGAWRPATAWLLEHHYDPLYARGEADREDLAVLDAADPEIVGRLEAVRRRLAG